MTNNYLPARNASHKRCRREIQKPNPNLLVGNWFLIRHWYLVIGYYSG